MIVDVHEARLAQVDAELAASRDELAEVAGWPDTTDEEFARWWESHLRLADLRDALHGEVTG